MSQGLARKFSRKLKHLKTFSVYPKHLLVQFKPNPLYLVISLSLCSLLFRQNNTNSLFILINELICGKHLVQFLTYNSKSNTRLLLLLAFLLIATLKLTGIVLFSILHSKDGETETHRRKSYLSRSPRHWTPAFNVQRPRAGISGWEHKKCLSESTSREDSCPSSAPVLGQMRGRSPCTASQELGWGVGGEGVIEATLWERIQKKDRK